MRRISSKLTFYYKRIFPVVFFGFILLAAGPSVFVSLKSSTFQPVIFLIMPAGMAVFAYFIFKKFVFDLVDEVWDAGDSLVVRNGAEEERIALTDIKNVSYAGFTSPQRVTLSLRHAGVFGHNVVFCPPMRLFAFWSNPVVEELIDRIDEQRLASARAHP
jgi:hypothetical protein